jgi:hypothetical protein
MASVKLSTKAVGSIVKLKVDGTLRDFIVVHQGKPSSLYDASCDGTWLLLKDCLEQKRWHSANTNDYKNSEIHSYLNNTWLNKLDANIRAQVKQVKLPYVNGTANSAVASGANGLSCKIFLLSGYEVGFTQSVNSYFPIDGVRLAYFQDGDGTAARNIRIANYNGSATYWWLRSPHTGNTNLAWHVLTNGLYDYSYCTYTYGIRPALVLPSSLLVSDDGSVSTNTAPTTPGSITIPSTIQGGSTITVQWTASTDAENNLDGYKVERSTDGGSSWSQIYQGSSLSTTNTVPAGTNTVMYRVKAYDTQGSESGYKISSQVTVINNQAPATPPSITIPNEVLGGGTVTITWGQASDPDGDLSGYELERKVDSGAWSQVYKGTATNYTDNVTRGWATVAYRVRAYDSHNATSAYAETPTRSVNNNLPPEITCANASGTDLGEKSSGFTVSYTASDPDEDTVTVKESIDGTVKRTFTATDAANSFQVTGETFMKLLNGKRTLTIEATDGKAITTHTLTFTKKVDELFITSTEPMTADAKITLCVLSVIGSIPADAEYTVEVTNNALDDTPVWEDCTTQVKTGANYIFENETAANGYAFNFRISAKRGASGVGGYITSVQGGFQ